MTTGKKLTSLNLATELTKNDISYIVDISDTTSDPSGTSKYSYLYDIMFPYVGGTGLSTVGTIASGEWQATPIASSYIGNHASKHELGGVDEIKLDELGESGDNENLNATPIYHGLMTKLNDNNGEYLTGINSWKNFQNPVPSGMIHFITTESSGNLSLDVRTSTGYYAVQLWDKSTQTNEEGVSSFAIPSYDSDYGGVAPKKVYIYSCADEGDITQDGDIIDFACEDSKIYEFYINNMVWLSYLSLDDNNITKLDLNGCDFYGGDNQYISVSNCNLIEEINLDTIESVEFNFQHNPRLERIWIKDGFTFPGFTTSYLNDCNLSEDILLDMANRMGSNIYQTEIDISNNPGVTSAVISAFENKNVVVIY
jgi:hypothetical protein